MSPPGEASTLRDETVEGTHRSTAGESWRAAGLSLAVAVAAAALVTFCFAPRFVLWRGLSMVEELPSRSAEFDRAIPSLEQVDDPWARIDNPTHKVIAWRLLFPVVWHYLGLPRWLYLAVPQIGCLLALWLAAWLTYGRLGRWWPTWMAATLFGALSWFFVSSGWLLHFDSWLVIGLLVAALVPERWALGLACLLTPWVDARFLIGLPATLSVRAAAREQISQKRWRNMLLDLAVALVASLPYPVIRIVAWMHGDADSAQYVESHWELVRTVPWMRFADGLWSGYRLGWLVLLAALPLVARRIGYRWGATFAIVVLASALGSMFIAFDISRNLMILSPAYLLGIWLWEEWRPQRLDRLLPSLLVINLFLLPAHHVLWINKWPVSSLPAEIRSWNDPPRMFAAAEWFRRGRTLNQQGKYAEAEQCFDAAIRVEGDYPRAFIERSLLLMRGGDTDKAAADLDEALRLRPRYSYALMLRGALRGNRGDMSQAADDLRRALELAPADWRYRQQAQHLLDQVTRLERPSLPLTSP